MSQDLSTSVMALDVGGRRIGVAIAGRIARLARPLTTLHAGPTTTADIQALIKAESVAALCVGLPRGLDGQQTQQTLAVKAFVHDLKKAIDIPVYFQDEAVTSRQAEAELEARGKPFAKTDIDALAATYILEDFLRDHAEVYA